MALTALNKIHGLILGAILVVNGLTTSLVVKTQKGTQLHTKGTSSSVHNCIPCSNLLL
jgi:hypothetical protein